MSYRAQFFLTVFAVVTMGALLFFPGVRGYIEDFALKYGYFGIFVLAFLGGVSLVIPLPWPAFLVGLVGIGLQPILLALAASLGATMGDVISYHIGQTGGKAFPSERMERIQNKIAEIYKKYPRFTPIILYLWSSLVPVPNELFVIPFGLSGYGFWKTMGIALAGNFTFGLLIASGAGLVFDFFE